MCCEHWRSYVRKRAPGWWWPKTAPSRRPLEEAATALGIADLVGLLGEVEDVAGVLAATDLFVSASRSEGMSNAVVQAGRPAW